MDHDKKILNKFNKTMIPGKPKEITKLTIEDLFGTLQQSVVAAWRKHLRGAKYSKHMALDEFYKKMPELVDNLIEVWMGAKGHKIDGFNNVIQSSNLNTIKYLQELRGVVKKGYELMEGEPELEACLDDILTLIDSTLYKVKELSENKLIDLKDFINESLKKKPINESFWLDECNEYPSNWALCDIFHETNRGAAAKLKNFDWEEYFDTDFVEAQGKNIIKTYTNFFEACSSISNEDVGNVDEGGFEDEEVRDYANISSDECGVALHKDGDDGTWTIITFKQPIDDMPKAQQSAVLDLMSKYSDSGMYIVEYFDTIDDDED